ncbi:hypothetical protein [Actinopolymorpha singaporensis]|uniref:Uncharacterized protein n=1 Tax=Actinopolymorpha singaporensis TaxID=117157 RepID=A0A1H1NF46_9ACTN|nr:hypothetical protein [Actinopolymorpha singaporensis]SDR97522.1 hypothetical protein SAMN04489717_1212 [Actinopolymorpha singaporensis]
MDNRNARIAAVIAAVVAVLSVVALMASTYLGSDRDTPAAEPTATTGDVDGPPAPAGPEIPTPTPTVPEEGSDHSDDPYTPDARTKATLVRISTRFLAEWKRPGTPAERTARLRPYATEWLTTRLARIDPADLPTASVKGKPAIVAATPYAAATSTPFDDGIRIRCNLVLDTTGWRVSEVLPDSDTPVPSPTASPPTKPGEPGAKPAATHSTSPSPRPTPSPSTTKRPGAP